MSLRSAWASQKDPVSKMKPTKPNHIWLCSLFIVVEGPKGKNFFLLLLGRVLLYSPGQPWTHTLSASAYQVPGWVPPPCPVNSLLRTDLISLYVCPLFQLLPLWRINATGIIIQQVEETVHTTMFLSSSLSSLYCVWSPGAFSVLLELETEKVVSACTADLDAFDDSACVAQPRSA